MIKINDVNDLFELEPQKYYAFSSSVSQNAQVEKINTLLASERYIFSEKTDGNLIRLVYTPDRFALQTRGRGVNSGVFGEIQNKVLWANAARDAFFDTTVLLGEAYIPGGTDKTVGSVLRSLDAKALRTQVPGNEVHYRIFDCLYYNGKSLLESPIKERISYLESAAKAINHPLVSYVKYYKASSDTFWEKLNGIFERGGEGVVLYDQLMTPVQGRTPAWQTLKVKQTLKTEADAFIVGVKEGERNYTGKELENWEYWVDNKNGSLLPIGSHNFEYQQGANITPVTRNWYRGLPASIECAVYNKEGKEIILCCCSNLTDEFKNELKNNWEHYDHMPVKLQAMLPSKDRFGNYSLRHPKLMSLRDKEEFDIKDATLEKIFGE